MLEIYDFMIYGYFAPIMAKLFFPTDNASLGLLLTFSIFAIGFLMRPLGAIIFGHFGDRLGRKKILAFAIILMAAPTTLIGLLPDYSQIGMWGGILLLICRLLQGLSMGGEFAGSILYITEHAPSGRRGFYGSWAMCGTFSGILLASAIAALLNILFSTESMQSFGWRIPFLLGSVLGIVGYYLRRRMPETPHFIAAQTEGKIVSNPVIKSFTHELPSMMRVAALNFLPAVAFYTLFVYLSSFMTTYLKISLDTALSINTINLIVLIFLIPVIGNWSDKIGRKPILISGTLGFIVFSYPLFLLLQTASFLNVFLAQACFSILIGFIFAALPATIVELTKTHVRYTAVAFPYNLSSALFGGTAPLLATYFISKTGNHLFPCFYLIISGLVTLIMVLSLNETYQEKLR